MGPKVFRLRVATAAVLLVLAHNTSWGQIETARTSADPALAEAVRQLQQQVRELQSAVTELRSEASQYRAETLALRRQLQNTNHADAQPEDRASAPYQNVATSTSSRESAATQVGQNETAVAAEPNSARLAKLEEEYQLLTGKVDEQYQTKVESASKYRVRLSGIVLLNLFNNVGNVRNIDIPILAEPPSPTLSGGSFGGTLRQSQLGLEVFGPDIAGARTRADLRVDFAGGFENTVNGVNAGLVRLQTGTMRMDWQHTSIVAGQDSLFFSPLAPTSFASLAIPALSYAGNLWSWTPQVRAEHRFTLSDTSDILLQGGILDSLSGDPPGDVYYRTAQAGELSRQPAYASRIAWEHTVFGQPLTVGAAGYYGRQNYGFGRTINGWAGMTDWNLPLGRLFSLSGKFYRGRAVGGLGGGVGQSVLFSRAAPGDYADIQPLDSLGGWSQLKFRPSAKVEFNTAFGQDNPYASQVRVFPGATGYFAGYIARNRGSFANVILRPRSDVILSAEYRYLRTFAIDNRDWTAHQVNLVMGVLF